MNDKQIAIHQQTDRLPAASSFNFDQIERMATAFAKSGLFGVKEQSQALALMFYAQAMGKHPALIMRDYDVIQGRLAKKSEVMLRDYQASGGSVEWVKYTDEEVVGVFRHPLSPTTVKVDWNLERAKKAGLAGKDGGMYNKYPRAMFRSRCISEGVRATAPDCTEQMHTPEEMRSIEQEEEPVKIDVAVTKVTEQSRNGVPKEELDELMKSLDVQTLPELTTAFGTAYTRAKGDDMGRKILKSRYDEVKDAIAAAAAEKEAAAERAAISGEGTQS